MFVEEAITNALKYAHPTGVKGEITVACGVNGRSGFVIEIADDGVGFPEGFKPEAGGSLGTRLMQTLAARIGAEAEFLSLDIGATVRLIKA